MERQTTESPSPDPPPQVLINALSRLSLYRLQERARSETDAGEFAAATRHLRNLAQQLQAQGQHDLSKTTMFEAETIERLQAFSEQGNKEVKYATRALMSPKLGITP
jgi:Ca-activated chloride channel family protein